MLFLAILILNIFVKKSLNLLLKNVGNRFSLVLERRRDRVTIGEAVNIKIDIELKVLWTIPLNPWMALSYENQNPTYTCRKSNEISQTYLPKILTLLGSIL